MTLSIISTNQGILKIKTFLRWNLFNTLFKYLNRFNIFSTTYCIVTYPSLIIDLLASWFSSPNISAVLNNISTTSKSVSKINRLCQTNIFWNEKNLLISINSIILCNRNLTNMSHWLLKDGTLHIRLFKQTPLYFIKEFAQTRNGVVTPVLSFRASYEINWTIIFLFFITHLKIDSTNFLTP